MKRISSKGVVKTAVVMMLLAFLLSVKVNHVEAAGGELKAVTISTGKEDVSAGSITGRMAASEVNEYVRGDVIKVKTDCAGLISFHFSSNSSDDISFTLCSDEALQNELAYTKLEASSEEKTTVGLAVPKAGTYYLELLSFSTEDIDYTISADIYSAEDDSLANGKAKLVTLLDNKDSNYYKFTMNQAGAIKVYTTYANGKECYIDVDICQKSGESYKTISSLEAVAEGSSIGLAKGTYYIKLSNGSDAYYSVKYAVSVSSDKSGSTKQKAASLKLGTASKGVIAIQDKTSKADWYKIKLTKAQAVTLSLSGDVTGIVSLDFYDSKDGYYGGLFVSKYTKEDAGEPYSIINGSKSKKLGKGTYYIKITKDDSKTSGSYSVKVK